MRQEIPESCQVCSEPMDLQQNATCAFCGRVFHVTLDTRQPVKDCGRFDIDDVSLALYFTCNPCIARGPSLPPVLS